MRNKKVDGALGAMVIEDQPTHSIYTLILSKYRVLFNSTKKKCQKRKAPIRTEPYRGTLPLVIP